jgi:hypothetical protein
MANQERLSIPVMPFAMPQELCARIPSELGRPEVDLDRGVSPGLSQSVVGRPSTQWDSCFRVSNARLLVSVRVVRLIKFKP